MDVSTAPDIERLRSQAFAGLVQLVEQARSAGVVRADFTTEDVVLLLMANAGLVERAQGISADASARLVHVLLDGFRATAATDGPIAPNPRRMRLAMRRNGERHLRSTRKDSPR